MEPEEVSASSKDCFDPINRLQMDREELEKLHTEAIACYERQDFERELAIWTKISEAEPQNPFWRHNKALALMNSGKLMEALELFNTLAEAHSDLSRVHNNRAILLMRLGVDMQYLVPVFVQALATSQDLPEFLRHFMNLCVTAAFGFEEGANEALSEIEEVSLDLLKRASPPDQPDQLKKNIKYLAQVVASYRNIGRFRAALARRKWRIAETELNAAEEKLIELDLSNLVRGLKHVKHTFQLCRDVVTLIEQIGADSAISPSLALETSEVLLKRACALVELERHSALSPLLDILGWFLTGIVETFRFLINPLDKYAVSKDARSAISQLSAAAFIELGRDLVSLLQFVDKQCAALAETSESLASKDIILVERDKTWTRIALFCNGVVFDFKTVDLALAKESLGWSQNPLEEARRDVQHFRSFIERQAHKDIFVDRRPQENIARSLLQAFMKPRSYREVPVRGGQTDLLTFTRYGRFLYETKIWRGIEYYQQGLRELGEYLIGENDDDNLKGIFYLVFDPTESRQAELKLGGPISTANVSGRTIDVIVISLVPPKPSKKL